MGIKPVIIVTGASRGLGAAVACWLAKAGAGVALMARSQEKLGQTAETVSQLGGEPLVKPADISDPEACRATVAQTLEHFGRLDALVNNAGLIQPISSIALTEPDAFSGKFLDYDDPRISRPSIETFSDHLR